MQLFGVVFSTFCGQKKKKKNWKHCSVRTEKLHWKKVKKKKSFWEDFFFQKNHFFRAKNATVTTWRSGTDFCWLFCDYKHLLMSNKLFAITNKMQAWLGSTNFQSSVNFANVFYYTYVDMQQLDGLGRSKIFCFFLFFCCFFFDIP